MLFCNKIFSVSYFGMMTEKFFFVILKKEKFTYFKGEEAEK